MNHAPKWAIRSLALALVGAAALPAAVAQEKTPVVVAGDKLEQTSRCTKDLPMIVTASNSRLSILGNCSVVRIEGSRNWITVQHAGRIVTTGNRNTVLYADRDTAVEDKGGANSVAERWPQ